jgi:sortase B
MKKVWLGLGLAAFAAAGVFAFLIWKQQAEKENTDELYRQIRQEVKVTDEALSESETEMKSESEEHEPLVIPVDFASLQEMNEDIYAWITVPGTAIDYPVVQDPQDDTYYITHSVDGSESVSGAIFSERANATDFSDVHTVLYGHNMRDGSMFAGLHQFEDEDFFDSHRTITVYTPDAIRTYQIFAAYLYDDRHLLQSFDCSDPAVFAAYIDSIRNQRNLYCFVDDEIEITEGDRILTLSTCHSMGDAYRYLVQAVLFEEKM